MALVSIRVGSNGGSGAIDELVLNFPFFDPHYTHIVGGGGGGDYHLITSDDALVYHHLLYLNKI